MEFVMFNIGRTSQNHSPSTSGSPEKIEIVKRFGEIFEKVKEHKNLLLPISKIEQFNELNAAADTAINLANIVTDKIEGEKTERNDNSKVNKSLIALQKILQPLSDQQITESCTDQQITESCTNPLIRLSHLIDKLVKIDDNTIDNKTIIESIRSFDATLIAISKLGKALSKNTNSKATFKSKEQKCINQCNSLNQLLTHLTVIMGDKISNYVEALAELYINKLLSTSENSTPGNSAQKDQNLHSLNEVLESCKSNYKDGFDALIKAATNTDTGTLKKIEELQTQFNKVFLERIDAIKSRIEHCIATVEKTEAGRRSSKASEKIILHTLIATVHEDENTFRAILSIATDFDRSTIGIERFLSISESKSSEEMIMLLGHLLPEAITIEPILDNIAKQSVSDKEDNILVKEGNILALLLAIEFVNSNKSEKPENYFNLLVELLDTVFTSSSSQTKKNNVSDNNILCTYSYTASNNKIHNDDLQIINKVYD